MVTGQNEKGFYTFISTNYPGRFVSSSFNRDGLTVWSLCAASRNVYKFSGKEGGRP
jgi:hypothetical protein